MKFTKINRNYYGYFFIAPFIIGFLIFGLYPVYNTIALSFTDYTLMTRSGKNIGLQNFQVLFADQFFLKAVANTWLIWMLNFIPQIGVALLLSAWFTNNRLRIKGVGVWRAIFYLPNLIMPVTIAVLFNALFSFYGPVNQIMVRAGFLSEAMHFLQNVEVSRAIVVFIQWWMWFGQTIIIVMAGMTSIPVHLYEAAMVDGASATQMFRRITLPLLKPILIFIFVTSLVGGMQMFDIPYLLTDGRGAPSNSIMTNNILMYMKFSSSKGHIGAASAVGVVTFIMTTICALGIFFFLRDKDESSFDKSIKKWSWFFKNKEKK
ncbi:MAG: sugar ABC transporter permease [Anaerolineales bacterium]|nr:sugar ABC transporter permease [Anaerolineales bacterium]